MKRMNSVFFEENFELNTSRFRSFVSFNTTRSSFRQTKQGFESVDSGIGGFVFYKNSQVFRLNTSMTKRLYL